MFDNHESVAVRHTGELIEKRMSDFMNEIHKQLDEMSDIYKHTPWYQLLHKDIINWDPAELGECYQYIIDHQWNSKSIRPPIELAYEVAYGDESIKEKLIAWCESDDRHITYKDALLWIETDECAKLMQKYIEQWSAEQTTNEYYSNFPDIFNSFNETAYQETSQISDLSYNKMSMRAKWFFIANQINYIDSIIPKLTTPMKIRWLRVALVSQPITEIFGKKVTYEKTIIRESELIKQIENKND